MKRLFWSVGIWALVAQLGCRTTPEPRDEPADALEAAAEAAEAQETAEPPVDRISTPLSAKNRPNSISPVLSDTDSRARLMGARSGATAAVMEASP